jgi:hypothetical protein
VFLLKLLAALEQLFVHLSQAAQFKLHFFASFPEFGLPAFLSFIEFDSDLLKPTMHFLDCSLVLLENVNCFLVLIVLELVQNLCFFVELSLEDFILFQKGLNLL